MMMLLSFVIGASVSSFCQVIGYRLPKKLSFIRGRSYCPHCLTSLRWYELIPIVSFVIQFGRCRTCQRKIPKLHVILEIGMGLLFSINFLILGMSIEFVMACLLFALLCIVFVTDILYMTIPNRVLLVFFPLFLAYQLIHPLYQWWEPVVGSLTGMLIVAIVILISKGGMGGGDMKFMAVLGSLLGPQRVLLTFVLACFIGAMIGFYLISFKNWETIRPMPFAPSIVMAVILTFYFGEQMFALYISLFT